MGDGGGGHASENWGTWGRSWWILILISVKFFSIFFSIS